MMHDAFSTRFRRVARSPSINEYIKSLVTEHPEEPKPAEIGAGADFGFKQIAYAKIRSIGY